MLSSWSGVLVQQQNGLEEDGRVQVQQWIAPRARPVLCADGGVGCVADEAGAGAMVGGAAVVVDERPDVGSNRAAAATAGDSALVSGVLMGE